MVAQIHERRVREVAVRDVVSVYPDDTLYEALSLMVENRVSALPVVDGHERCIGILSATDLLNVTQDLGDELNTVSHAAGLARALLADSKDNNGLLNQDVASLMSDVVISIGLEETLTKAAAAMVRSKVHRLVVVGENAKLVGIVSTMDILAALADDEPD